MTPSILIAEDDEDLCLLLELHLRSKGYNAMCVKSIEEAEIFLSTNSPSMILLDNNLHDGTAIHSIEKFKSRSPDLPFILMTADFIHDLKKHEHYNEFDGVLLKPFTPEKLNEILDRIAS